jgi:hypothetical protein
LIGDCNKDKETAYSASLFICLKDHKNTETMDILKESREYVVRKAVSKNGIEIEDVHLPEESNEIKSVHLNLTKHLDNETRNEIVNGLRKMEHLGLDLSLFNDIELSGNVFIVLFISRSTFLMRKN